MTSPINPYAPPQTPPSVELNSGAEGGSPQPWAIGEVLGAAWSIYKDHWAVLSGSFVAAAIAYYGVLMPMQFVLVALASGAQRGVRHDAAPDPGEGLPTTGDIPPFNVAILPYLFALLLVSTILVGFLFGGSVRIWLRAARGETPAFADLFAVGPRLLPLIVAYAACTLVTSAASLLLFIPGIVAALGLFYVPFVIMDSSAGVVDSMKTSWSISDGHRLHLLGFMFVAWALVIMSGMMTCGLAWLVVLPVFGLATTIVYTRISGRTGSASMASSGVAR